MIRETDGTKIMGRKKSMDALEPLESQALEFQPSSANASTPIARRICPQPNQDEPSSSQYSHITGHEEKVVDKFFDQEVQLSIGAQGRELTEEEMANVKVENFEALSFTSQLSANVARTGFSKPTPIQKFAMKSIQDGKDLMACSQTGSGKTAAFLLPIMNKLLWDADLSIIADGPCKPQALILSPTRELAIQTYNVASRFAFNTLCKVQIGYGGSAFWQQKKLVEKGVIILVGTPGRIKHFIEEGIVSLEQTKFLVLDEADRMLDLGFADDLKSIMEKGKIASKEERQTLLFSATFPRAVQTLANDLLRDEYLKIVVDKIGAASKSITQEFVEVEKRQKKAKLVQMLGVDLKMYEQSKELEIFKKKTLIFVASKTMADSLGVFLSENGVPTTTTHGDREQAQRESALKDFRDGKTPILIATAVAERGLDISGVDHVINFDMPKEITDYVHRIGRTGRLGNAGHSTSFIDAETDYEILYPLIRQLREAEQVVPEWLSCLDGAHYVRDEDVADMTWGGRQFSKDCNITWPHNATGCEEPAAAADWGDVGSNVDWGGVDSAAQPETQVEWGGDAVTKTDSQVKIEQPEAEPETQVNWGDEFTPNAVSCTEVEAQMVGDAGVNAEPEDEEEIDVNTPDWVENPKEWQGNVEGPDCGFFPSLLSWGGSIGKGW